MMIMCRLIVPLLCFLSSSRSFEISQSSANIGNDEDNPAYSGSGTIPIEIECRLNLRDEEQWTKCSWSHYFKDVYASNGDQGYVYCSVLPDHDDSNPRHQDYACKDQGNLAGQNQGWSNEDVSWVSDYMKRMTFLVSDNSCGLRIETPNANDTGEWKCHVDNNNPNQPAVMWSAVEIFVANQSEVAITDPDLEEDPDVVLEIDLSSGRPEISAECTASHGIPKPIIKWYIDEPNQELRDRDFEDIDQQEDEKENTVTSSVTLKLDEAKLQKWGIDASQPFAFSLGCTPDQGNYFVEENRRDNRFSKGKGREVRPTRNHAEIQVYGTSSAKRTATAGIMVLLAAVAINISTL